MNTGLCGIFGGSVTPGKRSGFDARAHRSIARCRERQGIMEVPEDERTHLKGFLKAQQGFMRVLARIDALDETPRPDPLPPGPDAEESAMLKDESVYESFGGVRLKLMKTEEGRRSGAKGDRLIRLAERIGNVRLDTIIALGLLRKEQTRMLEILLRNRFAQQAYPLAVDPDIRTGKDFQREAAKEDIVVCFENNAEREAWARVHIDGKRAAASLRTVKTLRYQQAGPEGGRGKILETVTVFFAEKTSDTAELVCLRDLEDNEGTVLKRTIPFGRRRLKKLTRWEKRRRRLEEGKPFVFAFRWGRKPLVRDPEIIRGYIGEVFGGNKWSAVERERRTSLEREETHLKL